MTHNADFWSSAEAERKILQTKLCLAESPTDPCAGNIIKAHTIPRSQLKKIATNGHVYAVRATAEDFIRNDGLIVADKVGVNRFSVFNCFCAKHDNALFAPVEDFPLIFDPRQLAVLHYRAVGMELYKKFVAHHATTAELRRHRQQRKKKWDYDTLKFLMDSIGGQLLALHNTGITLNSVSQMLDADNFDGLSALVLHFKDTPSIMTVGALIPEFDYNSIRSQRLGNLLFPYEIVSFNILTSEEHAALAMVWLKGQKHAEVFAKSFIDQKSGYYTTLAIQTAFEYIENTCMAYSWWDRLLQVQKNLLLQRMVVGGSQERDARALEYGGVTFDQWHYDHHEFINI